jgi:hypothetical protein
MFRPGQETDKLDNNIRLGNYILCIQFRVQRELISGGDIL